MLNQPDTIHVDDGMEAILKLIDIQNPEKTFVIITDLVYQEIRNSASKQPEDSYMTPDGKPSQNLFSEITVCQTYTIRAKQVFLDGRSSCVWIVLALTLGTLSDRKNFSVKKPEKVIIVAKK